MKKLFTLLSGALLLGLGQMSAATIPVTFNLPSSAPDAIVSLKNGFYGTETDITSSSQLNGYTFNTENTYLLIGFKSQEGPSGIEAVYDIASVNVSFKTSNSSDTFLASGSFGYGGLSSTIEVPEAATSLDITVVLNDPSNISFFLTCHDISGVSITNPANGGVFYFGTTSLMSYTFTDGANQINIEPYYGYIATVDGASGNGPVYTVANNDNIEIEVEEDYSIYEKIGTEAGYLMFTLEDEDLFSEAYFTVNGGSLKNPLNIYSDMLVVMIGDTYTFNVTSVDSNSPISGYINGVLTDITQGTWVFNYEALAGAYGYPFDELSIFGTEQDNFRVSIRTEQDVDLNDVVITSGQGGTLIDWDGARYYMINGNEINFQLYDQDLVVWVNGEIFDLEEEDFYGTTMWTNYLAIKENTEIVINYGDEPTPIPDTYVGINFANPQVVYEFINSVWFNDEEMLANPTAAELASLEVLFPADYEGVNGVLEITFNDIKGGSLYNILDVTATYTLAEDDETPLKATVNYENYTATINIPVAAADVNITVVYEGMTGIGSINVENGNDVIYNLQGVRMNGDRLPAGIYIINGKKVAVK